MTNECGHESPTAPLRINGLICLFWECVCRALFGYDGQTNVLKVMSSGDGGLVELADELNTGKIMYAYVRVQDPKTSLMKYVLINWQVCVVRV